MKSKENIENLKHLIGIYLFLILSLCGFVVCIFFNPTIINILLLTSSIISMKIFYNRIYYHILKNSDNIAEEMIRLKHKKIYKGIFN